MKRDRTPRYVMLLLVAVAAALMALPERASAAISCSRNVTADIVAIDKPLMYNRLGAGNVNGMMYALRRDVVNVNSLLPLRNDANPALQGLPIVGQLDLRPDKRHRPIVLRVRVGDCLTVNFQNLLTAAANPFPRTPTPAGQEFSPQPWNVDDQAAERRAGFHVSGLQLVSSIRDDGSNVGANGAAGNGLVGSGQRTSYTLYAAKEGVFAVSNLAATFGSDGNMGSNSNGLFGQVIVEPAGAESFRSQVFEEELRLAADGNFDGVLDATETTPLGQPLINYDATYPLVEPWLSEGKAGLPILAMMTPAGEIVHSEINAINAFRNTSGALGAFPATTYPLESVGRRNPTLPNRLEPFRDFASVFHDETVNVQAFPGFFIQQFSPGQNPVMPYVLEGVKDAFMINYGSGGIGSEIIANRLGVGPMHDCLSCAYEEFFLTSFAVGDPALTVDIPANQGLESCGFNGTAVVCPGAATPLPVGIKANYVIGAEDPSNVHHSYTGDFVKFRNTHNGKEQHVFHLHNHQWLYNPNDDNSNYLDAQGIGPGAGYTYEINFGGSGNRNKSSGDAIFHCHFYPHFAQGMWYHWRHNDTFQLGTILAATPNTQDAQGFAGATSYHTTPWALGRPIVDPVTLVVQSIPAPAVGARAYPDGEIAAGTPIPALVPLPGKPMPVMPGRATVATKFAPDGVTVLGSNAKVIDRNVNPGYPFWIAGIEDVVGQRPPTPVLDMASAADVARAKAADPALFANLNTAQADGWDGGLPRNALQGVAHAKAVAPEPFLSVVSALDFSKVVHAAKPVYYPEEGTDLEQVAMAFHAMRCHDTFLPDGSPATCTGGTPLTLKGITGKVTPPTNNSSVAAGGFITNGGGGPVIGAPFHNPCMDDQGRVLKANVLGSFFSGESATGNPMNTQGRSVFNSDTPRIYKGTFLQYDAVLTKTGYHYPQQRIVALWQDVGPIVAKNKPGEPLVFRANTFDCTVYHNSNLVPEAYEIDDYQVRTPTDIIGQHIHLPKWDLTTTDGAANGWNYEDGTLSPGAVRERIHAINAYVADGGTPEAGTGAGTVPVPTNLTAATHPYFGSVATALGGEFPAKWAGARTTTQRWFTDPVVNTEGVDRGLGIIFTHDHYGPSTHQQIGLYATLLTEPAASRWVHNETGGGLGCTTAVNTTKPAGTTTANNTACRWDGGPTSWQAAILPQPQTLGQTVQARQCVVGAAGDVNGVNCLDPFREFYYEFSDFQHAYEAGVYVGTGQNGLPLAGTGPGAGPKVVNAGNPAFNGTTTDAFRFAINPPARAQIAPVFPDLVLEAAGGIVPGCPVRPCPQAIDVQDPGMLSVNYRAEPVGLRIYDPVKVGPDGKPGMQADGQRGDLAFALQSRTDRAIVQLNVQPTAATVINGTRFPPPINAGGAGPGDPFTPMMRVYAGDKIRMKVQSGGHEEEHNASIHGVKWLQAGSGHGRAPNSGWRNAQAAGISEQFTFFAPVVPSKNSLGNQADYAWSVDGGTDGWWSGMWGLMRAYNTAQTGLFQLPNTGALPIRIANPNAFNGVCPAGAPARTYDITAVLANNALTNALGATIPSNATPTTNVGGPLNPAGGTLVHNHRVAVATGVDALGNPVTHTGPIHDPTAILYVPTADLDAAGRLLPGRPVEPLVLRAAAGECVTVTLRNRLPGAALAATTGRSAAPDLPTYSTISGVVKRDRAGAQGATTFNTNLFRPSNYVGLHPQLVAYDVTRDDGTVVGSNSAGQQLLEPGKNKTSTWYVGDLNANLTANRQFTIVATPVEFGGSNLMPADKIKQGAKSLVGSLVAEPVGSTWVQDFQVLDRQTGTGTRATRTQAKLNGDTARDFSVVLTKGNTHYYKDSSPVEHVNGEGVGLPEDSQEASGMLLNYGIEPAWFRFGILPQAPFGRGHGEGTAYGDIPNAGDYYSNLLTVPVVGGPQGDPATPVLLAKAGQETRIHITVPHGTTRGSTFSLHGHVWQRDPYVCPGENRNGLTGACNMGSVGSRALGVNPQAFAQGGQESWNAPSHFSIFLPGAGGWPAAGGDNAVAGDYLFRDHASFGSASGVWGILRVQP